MLVDLGSKSEGLIPPHEMHSLGADPLSKVAVGDKILVYVMQPEADQGQVTLSDRSRARRARLARAADSASKRARRSTAK